MQGIYIRNDDLGPTRPKSKKQLKEIPANRIILEATSMFGDEPDGLASELPVGAKVYFVGPDPHTSRKFYGTITRTEEGVKIA